MKKLLGLLTVILLCVVVFAACGKQTDVSKDVAVTFYPGNGDSSITVITDGILHSDVCPTVSYLGYDFAGWCFDLDGTQKVNFPLELDKETAIYASWVKQQGTPSRATFVTNGGSAVGSVVGTTLEQAPSTIREGYTLDGWYTDETFTTLAHFPYTLEKDTVFYAKFRLTGVSYDTDEEANTLVFRWPAVEGMTYRAEVQESPVDVFVSGGIATFSLPVKDSAFTVTVGRHNGVGITEFFRKSFKKLDAFSLSDANVSQDGENVKFVLPDNENGYQISVFDAFSDSEIIYSLTGNEFSLPANYFTREKSVCFRNVKDDPQTVYYSLRSEKINIARLETPVFGRYRDADQNITWSAVENANNYTVSVYSGEDIIYTEENVTPEKTDQSGTAYYTFVPDKLFPKGDYTEFSIAVKAEGTIAPDRLILASVESERKNVSFIGATQISLVEDKIVWTKVDNAASYDVTVLHNGITSNDPAARYESIELSSGGVYQVTVRPNVQGLNGYTVSAIGSYTLLSLPSIAVNVRANGITVTWDEVPNASSYTINVTDKNTGTVLHSLNSNLSNRFLTFNNSDFPEGDSELSVTALGDGEYYNNSPASFVTIHRLAKPEVDVSTKDTQISVKITVTDKFAKYNINHTSIQGYQDGEEEGTGIKEIVLDQKNVGVEDVSFDLKVKAVPYQGYTGEYKPTHNPLEAALYYIDSDEIVKTIELLCKPINFNLSEQNVLSWKSDGEMANYEIKLDDTTAEGLTLPVNSTSVSISDVLEKYGKSVLEEGKHTFYLRRTKPAGSVLFSDYVQLDLKKLSAPVGLTLKDRVLNWGVVQDEGLLGYNVVSGVDPFVMTATSNFLMTNNYNVQLDVSTSGATDIYFRVISKGSFSDKVLDSEPSEPFKIQRLPRPVLSIYDGIVSWEESAGNTFELYDGNIVELSNIIGNTYDATRSEVGTHVFRLKAVSSDPIVFDSELSEPLQVRRLETPVLEKVEYGQDFDYRIGIRIKDGLDTQSVFFRFEADELADKYVKINTVDSYDYVFYPETNGSLKAGRYSVKVVAVGDGVNYISSDESNVIEYYKTPAPNVVVDYNNTLARWTQNSDVESALATSFAVRFNGEYLSINVGEESSFSLSLSRAVAGSNTFGLKAISKGNVSSDAVQTIINKLTEPNAYYNGTQVVTDKEVNGEKFIYTLNGSQTALNDKGVWNIVDLALNVGINNFTFKRIADNYLESEISTFDLRKLAKPVLEFVDQDNNVKWTAVSYANNYVYSFENVSRETADTNILVDYNVGENLIEVYSKTEGCVPSDISQIRVVKLAKPTVEITESKLNWTAPFGADRYQVTQNGVTKTQTTLEYDFDFTNIKVGQNSFSVVAYSDGKVESDVVEKSIIKLTQPEPIYNGNAVVMARELSADKYLYTLNGGDPILSTSNTLNISDLALTVGINTFTIQRKMDGYIPSDITTFTLRKLASPVLTFNDSDNKVYWTAIEYANDYVYTFESTSTSTEELSILVDYKAGENVIKVFARADGAVPSDISEIRVVKLATPVIEKTLGKLTWSIPYGATSFTVTQNGVETTTTGNEYTVDELNIVEGTNTFTVVATADGKVSSAVSSAIISKLYKPVITTVSLDRITWGEVRGATEYIYTFNGKEYTTDKAEAVLDISELPSGTFVFTVKAVGDDKFDSQIVNQDLTRVAAPSLTIVDDKVTWDVDNDALYYVVYADGVKVYQGTDAYYEYGDAKTITVFGVNGIAGVSATITIEE